MPFDARVAISSHLPEDQSHFNIVHRTYQTGKGNSPARKSYTAPVALSSPRLMKIVDEKPDTLFIDSSKSATLIQRCINSFDFLTCPPQPSPSRISIV